MEALDQIETQVLTPDDVELAGTLLRVGDLVAIPTETVYGLGANGLAADAMERIYAAKGRPSDNPLILHVCDQSMVHRLVRHITPLEQTLMDTFWPGPLTITFEKSALVPERATGGLSRVALRCPNHDVCREMIRIAGVPIAAPSANRSGRPSPTTAEAVLHDMKGRIHAVVDAGPCEIGVESTVVQVEGDTVIILRPGGVTKEMLEMVADHVVYDTALHDPTEAPKSPGMKYRHYAPDMPVQVLVGSSEAVVKAIESKVLERNLRGTVNTVSIGSENSEITIDKYIQEGSSVHTGKNSSNLYIHKRIGLFVSQQIWDRLIETWDVEVQAVIGGTHISHLLSLGSGADTQKIVGIIYGETAEPVSLANQLYEGLLAFNEKDVDLLIVEGCEKVGLGVAVMNRLEKASGGNMSYLD
jgi:sua5/yciO/yrdC/ywlC family protein